MTDPSPFLSTIASTSAALVAIIGGLLVARFVTLDSEQEGAQHLLDDGEQRLEKARQRHQTACDDLRRWDVREFFTRDVIRAIGRDERDISELREIGPYTSLSDEDMTTEVARLSAEFARARETLRPLIPSNTTVRDSGRWDEFKKRIPSISQIKNDDVWSMAYNEFLVSPVSQRPSITGFDMAGFAVRPSDDFATLQIQRHDGLIDEVNQTFRQVEDLEGEVDRLRKSRDMIVRPKGLGAGLVVLALFTAVGVIYPIWIMGHAPKDLTRSISRPVFITFAIGIVVLFGYMGWLALRLSGWFRKRTKSSVSSAPDN